MTIGDIGEVEIPDAVENWAGIDDLHAAHDMWMMTDE
jgi:hypothetical protein